MDARQIWFLYFFLLTRVIAQFPSCFNQRSEKIISEFESTRQVSVTKDGQYLVSSFQWETGMKLFHRTGSYNFNVTWIGIDNSVGWVRISNDETKLFVGKFASFEVRDFRNKTLGGPVPVYDSNTLAPYDIEATVFLRNDTRAIMGYKLSGGGTYLELWDLSNPNAIVLSFTSTLTETISGLSLSNDENTLYVAQSASGVTVIDISILNNFNTALSIPGTNVDYVLAPKSSTQYLFTVWNKYFQSVRATDFVTLDSIVIPGNIYDVQFNADESLVYIATNTGIFAINVTDIYNLKEAGFIAIPLAQSITFIEGGSKAIISAPYAATYVIDLSSIVGSKLSALSGKFPFTKNQYPTSLAVNSNGTRAYISFPNSMMSFDTSGVGDPTLRTDEDLYGAFEFTLSANEKLLFGASFDSLRIVQADNLDQLSSLSGNFVSVSEDGNYFFLTSPNSLKIFNTSNSTLIPHSNMTFSGGVQGVSQYGDRLFINNNGTLIVYNISNINSPSEIGRSSKLQNLVWAVVISSDGKYAISPLSGDDDYEVIVFNLSNLPLITHSTSTRFLFDGNSFSTVKQDWMFSNGYEYGVFISRIQNGNVTLQGNLQTVGIAITQQVRCVDGALQIYVHTNYGLEIYRCDIGQPGFCPAVDSQSSSANPAWLIVVIPLVAIGLIAIVVIIIVIVKKSKSTNHSNVEMKAINLHESPSGNQKESVEKADSKYVAMSGVEQSNHYQPIIPKSDVDDFPANAETPKKKKKKYEINYNEFVIKEPLGEGHYGKVYQAEWRKMMIAVKELKNVNISEKEIQQFIDETVIMKKMTPHQNVVQFMGFSMDPLCIVTEFCQNGSLSDLLKKQSVQLEFPRKFKFITDIAKGMLHLSLEGILHKDLAARNVLITEHFAAKVSDFGLSKLGEKNAEQTENAYVIKSNVGPLKWMAPELFSNRIFTSASDEQFSTKIDEEHQKASSYVPSDTPVRLRSLIQRCLSVDPQKRPTFEEICQDLEDQEKALPK